MLTKNYKLGTKHVIGAVVMEGTEREMCLWAISKYFGD
jgi:hypothetical protein